MAFARMNNWSFWLLPVAAIAADRFVFRPGRRARGRLDHLCAAVHPDGPGHGSRHFRAAYHGRLQHHGLDQHHHHHPQHARPGDDADENADVRVDLADHRLPADRGDAGARRRDHHDAHRPPLRHLVLQRGRRRRPGDVPAHLLVLRPSRGLHHDPAGVRHHQPGDPGLRAQAPVRLRLDGVRDFLDRDPVVHRLGAPHVHRRAADRRACCSSCTPPC